MEKYYFFMALFLLPIFPFSMLTNRFLYKMHPKVLIYSQFVFLIAGTYLLQKSSTTLNPLWLQLFASASMLFYAFRLLSVDHLRDFILYFSTVITSFAWLWYSMGGNMEDFLIMEFPAFAAFCVLVTLLYERYEVVHRHTINGLGSKMPAFSTLFVLSLFAIAFTPLFSASLILKEALHLFTFSSGIVVVLAWFLLNWSIIRIVEWLIFSNPSRQMQYDRFTIKEITPISLLLLVSMVIFFVFAAGGFA